MKMHANARLSLKGRELLIARVENARKWRARYRAEGDDGLLDRSSAPVLVTNRTEEHRVEVIAALRRLRMTGAEIAECLEYGALDRVGDPDPDWAGQARPARAGARTALRTSSSR